MRHRGEHQVVGLRCRASAVGPIWPAVWVAVSLWTGPAEGQTPDGGGTGSIQGTTVLAPSLTARKVRFRLYSNYGPGELPPRTSPDPNELTNVVVYLEPAPTDPVATGTAAGSARRPASMEQSDERFVPHVVPVMVGSVVEFPNRDPVYHNVFSLSGTKSFDLGRFPRGASKSVRFDKAGVVPVFCHIHSDMSGVILVLSSPYYATVDSSGRYTIDGVPPGEYRIVGWHERIKPITRTVKVEAGQSVTMDFTIPVMNER